MTAPALDIPPAGATAALEVTGLSVTIPTPSGPLRAVSDVTFRVAAGEIVGIVGESGCGKTTLALSILRLQTPSATVHGHVLVDGVDVLAADARHLLDLRRRSLGYVPQDPLSSLDPTFSVGAQLVERIRAIEPRMSRREARDRAVELLVSVGIRDAAGRLRAAPHQFSGGMRQRVAIAVAVAAHPKLVVADEPTTALDVTVQRQILELLVARAVDNDTGLCLITHDLAVVADACDRVVVMYAGRIVEEGLTDQVLATPRHPYTQALLTATPRGDVARGALPTIPGRPPDLRHTGDGCSFADRCPHAWEACAERPPLAAVGHGGLTACWLTSPDDADSPDGPYAAPLDDSSGVPPADRSTSTSTSDMSGGVLP